MSNQQLFKTVLTQVLGILFFISVLCGYDAAKIGGLQFNSNYDLDSNGNPAKTKLVIPRDGPIHFTIDVEFSFEIYFWHKDPFGFILSAGNESICDFFILSYSEYRHPDTSYIELTLKDKPSVISIPIQDKLQGKNIWKFLSIRLEYTRNRIGISFDNNDVSRYESEVHLLHDLQFRFGGTSRKIEPPRMAIRNIQIREKFHQDISWLLNEMTGEVAHGSSKNGGKYLGKVKNGNWLSGHHTWWQRDYSCDITGKYFQYLGFNDDINQSIYIKNDSLYFQNPSNPTMATRYPFIRLPPKYNYIYDYQTHQLVSWHDGGRQPNRYI